QCFFDRVAEDEPSRGGGKVTGKLAVGLAPPMAAERRPNRRELVAPRKRRQQILAPPSARHDGGSRTVRQRVHERRASPRDLYRIHVRETFESGRDHDEDSWGTALSAARSRA